MSPLTFYLMTLEQFILSMGPRPMDQVKEERKREFDRYKLPDQDLLVDAEARAGRPIHFDEFIKTVERLADHKVWVEWSWGQTNGLNFYRMKRGKKQCCKAAFQDGVLPEYTILHLDKNGLPYSKTVGWRDVLHKLMKAKVLTLKQVEKAFGPPTPTPSDRWQKQIKNLR